MLTKTLKRLWSSIVEQKTLAIFLSLSFVLGFALGLFLAGEKEKILFSENSINFVVVSLGKDSSVFSLFFARIVANIGFFLLFYLFGLTLWLCPLQFFLLIYKGYVMGAAFMVFFSSFKITGIVLFLFAVFIQNVISTAALILFSVNAYTLIKDSKICNKIDFKSYTKLSLMCFLLSLIGALVELLMLLLVLRPLNFYF